MCYGTILEDSLRRARKAYRCQSGSCKRTIAVGVQYNYSVMVRDGTIETWKLCERCRAKQEAAEPDQDGCVYDLRDSLLYEVEKRGWRGLRRYLRESIARFRESDAQRRERQRAHRARRDATEERG